MVTKIAILSIGLGLAIMIVAFAILEGFRDEIRNKIVSFGGHLQISKYDTNNSFEEAPINRYKVTAGLGPVKGIAHLQPYARKTAIVKTAEEVAGVVLKGVTPEYNLQAFHRLLKAGKPLALSDTGMTNSILISQRLADRLRLGPDSTALFYFIQQPPRVRRFKVSGVFSSGLEEFDDLYVIGDLRQIQALNNWPDSLVGGYEVLLTDFNKLDRVALQVYDQMPYDLQLMKISDIYIQLFDWLALLKRNVQIFIVLILFVATFNMMSTLFIMILERTPMIGLLKALGATNAQARQLFFYKAMQLTLRGLLLGNAIGLGFCALQYFTHLIPLDPENYYMDTVPIRWNWPVFALLNAAIFVTSLVTVFVPATLIARIRPVKAIRFD